MKLSHSKLKTILECPMTYYLKYIQGIQCKVKKSALSIGTQVHWCIEHNTEDLTKYFEEVGERKQIEEFTREELLAESMAHGYFKHKDEIFEKILTDYETGEKINLLEETHEVFLSSPLKSYKENTEHEFIGIIDLLLLTNKGFILVDYKTSSQVPNWDNYLDQLYRYIFELKSNFPDIPVYKIAIINLRKTNIRQKKNENSDEFLNRLKFEYDINDESYVNYHEFLPDTLNEKLIDDYIMNLSKMADLADDIDKNKLFYINYSAANGQYGKSDYWDIFYNTPDCENLYEISDYIWDEDEKEFKETRDCIALDMKVINNSNVLNKYSIFKQELLDTNTQSKEEFYSELSEKYLVDRNLLDIYWQTYVKEQKEVKSA